MLLEIFTLVLGIPFKLALECYVCTNVEGNWNECIRTVQTCDPSQDTCQSIVQYRTPPFWTVLAERRAFVTKGCTTTSGCEMTSSVTSQHCSRSKTRDWICSYCCNTDRCNYYVPGTASRPSTVHGCLILSTTFLWNINNSCDDKFSGDYLNESQKLISTNYDQLCNSNIIYC
ncbi:unnamed protein product [Heterobilharzia americana]|nr:unnamed protein product [Heterobilharzia americana]